MYQKTDEGGSQNPAAGQLDKLRRDFAGINWGRKEEDEGLRGCSGVTAKMLLLRAGEMGDLGAQWNCPHSGGSNRLRENSMPGADGLRLPE